MYKNLEQRKEARRKSQKKYRISFKGKDAYNKSQQKWRKSLKGEESRRKYEENPKSKELHRKRVQKYRNTSKGNDMTKRADKKYNNTPKGKDRQYRANLKKRYNIGVDEYDTIFEKQHGRCAICFDPPKDNKHFAVDHNHTTGKVRGLLCRKCNSAIGLLKESVSILQNAICYIENDK
jgi:Recombination endonuclease VII